MHLGGYILDTDVCHISDDSFSVAGGAEARGRPHRAWHGVFGTRKGWLEHCHSLWVPTKYNHCCQNVERGP